MMMMRATILLCALGCSALLSGQQTIDPAPNHRDNDRATFGNKKNPKKEKTPTSRTVTGQVTDETGQVLEGAMVTLTDKVTNARTSFFTKKDGHYQFEELSFTKDYEVQARYKNFSSDARKLSQFDVAPRPVRILQINTGAKPAPGAAAENKQP
jgi:hypothetical protein